MHPGSEPRSSRRCQSSHWLRNESSQAESVGGRTVSGRDVVVARVIDADISSDFAGGSRLIAE